MAKIALTKSQQLQQKLKRKTQEIRHQVIDNGIKQKELAEITGLSQQAISYQLKSGNISFQLLVAIEYLINNQ